jgi:hypothetical protein
MSGTGVFKGSLRTLVARISSTFLSTICSIFSFETPAAQPFLRGLPLVRPSLKGLEGTESAVRLTESTPRRCEGMPDELDGLDAALALSEYTVKALVDLLLLRDAIAFFIDASSVPARGRSGCRWIEGPLIDGMVRVGGGPRNIGSFSISFTSIFLVRFAKFNELSGDAVSNCTVC